MNLHESSLPGWFMRVNTMPWMTFWCLPVIFPGDSAPWPQPQEIGCVCYGAVFSSSRSSSLDNTVLKLCAANTFMIGPLELWSSKS